MSSEEMNKFLDSIGGLENGLYTDKPPITDCEFFSVSSGCYPLIKELIEDIIKLQYENLIYANIE